MLFFFTLILLRIIFIHSSTFYVSYTNPFADCSFIKNNGSDGSFDYPFKTIEQAVTSINLIQVSGDPDVDILLLDREITFSSRFKVNLTAKDGLKINIRPFAKTSVISIILEDSFDGISLKGQFSWANFTWISKGNINETVLSRGSLFQVESFSSFELSYCNFKNPKLISTIILTESFSKVRIGNSKFINSLNDYKINSLQKSQSLHQEFHTLLYAGDQISLSIESVEIKGIIALQLLFIKNKTYIEISELTIKDCVFHQTLIQLNHLTNMSVSDLLLEYTHLGVAVDVFGNDSNIIIKNTRFLKTYTSNTLFRTNGSSNRFVFEKAKFGIQVWDLGCNVNPILFGFYEYKTVILIRQIEIKLIFPNTVKNYVSFLINLTGLSSIEMTEIFFMSTISLPTLAPISNFGFNVTLKDALFSGFPYVFELKGGVLELSKTLILSREKKYSIMEESMGTEIRKYFNFEIPAEKLIKRRFFLTNFLFTNTSVKGRDLTPCSYYETPNGSFIINYLSYDKAVKIVRWAKGETLGTGSLFENLKIKEQNLTTEELNLTIKELNFTIRRSQSVLTECLICFERGILKCDYNKILALNVDDDLRVILFFREFESFVCLTDFKQENNSLKPYFLDNISISTVFFIPFNILLHIHFTSCMTDSLALVIENSRGVCKACENYYALSVYGYCVPQPIALTNSFVYYSHNQTVPSSGFWRHENLGSCKTEAFLPCLRREACLGDANYADYNETIDLYEPLENLRVKAFCGGKCANGYDGFLCASCSVENSFINRRFECRSCSKSVVLMILCFLTRIFLIGLATDLALELNSYKLDDKRLGFNPSSEPVGTWTNLKTKRFQLFILLFDHVQSVQLLFESSIYLPFDHALLEEITTFFIYSIAPELDQLFLIRNCFQNKGTREIFWMVNLLTVPLVLSIIYLYFRKQSKCGLRKFFVILAGFTFIDQMRPFLERLICVEIQGKYRSVKDLNIHCDSNQYLVSTILSAFFLAVITLMPGIFSIGFKKNQIIKALVVDFVQYLLLNFEFFKRIFFMILSCLLVNMKLSELEWHVPILITALCLINLLLRTGKPHSHLISEETLSLTTLIISSSIMSNTLKYQNYGAKDDIWTQGLFLAFLSINWLVFVLFILKIITTWLRERKAREENRSSKRNTARLSSQAKVSQIEGNHANSEEAGPPLDRDTPINKHKLTEEFKGLRLLQENPLLQGEINFNLDYKSEESITANHQSAHSEHHRIPSTFKQDLNNSILIGKMNKQICHLEESLVKLMNGLRLLDKQNKKLKKEIARLNGGKRIPMNSMSFKADKRGPLITSRPLEKFHKDMKSASMEFEHFVPSLDENSTVDNIFISQKIEKTIERKESSGISVITLKKELRKNPACLSINLCIMNKRDNKIINIDSIKFKAKTPDLSFILDKKPEGPVQIEPNREFSIELLVRYQTSINYLLRDPGVIDIRLTGRNWECEHKLELFWWDFLEELSPIIDSEKSIDFNLYIGKTLGDCLENRKIDEEEIVIEFESMFYCISLMHVLQDVDELLLNLLMHRPKAVLVDRCLSKDLRCLTSPEGEEFLVRDMASFALSRVEIPLDELEARVVVAVLKDRVMIGFRVEEWKLRKAEDLGYIHGKELTNLLRLYADRFYLNFFNEIKGVECSSLK